MVIGISSRLDIISFNLEAMD